jgi:hypothetical protein
MRSLILWLALGVLLITGCQEGPDPADGADSELILLREAVATFQAGQQKFKESIATVRDEESFDAAKPALDQVIADWKEVAAVLSGLEPPDEGTRASFRVALAEGHRRTEPTGEDMLGFFSIESREAEVTRWFTAFAAAGSEVGAEFERLFGTIDYGASGPELPMEERGELEEE